MILGVPCLRRVDMLTRLIDSVVHGSRVPAKILVVDNSGGPVVDALDDRGYLRGITQVIYSGPNIGVAASWNRLLKAGAWVISNDDVVFNHRTFEELSDALEGGKLFVNGTVARKVGVGEGWALFGQRPEVAEKIGYYDESFFPAYYEDDDYEVRLIEAGIIFEREEVLSSPAAHHGWASSRDEVTDELLDAAEHRRVYDRSYQNFVRKWRGPPDRVKAIKRGLAELRFGKGSST